MKINKPKYKIIYQSKENVWGKYKNSDKLKNLHKKRIISAIGKTRSKNTVQPLIDFYKLDRDHIFSSEVLLALADINDPASVPFLFEVIDERNIHRGNLAFIALQEMKEVNVVLKLVSYLASEDDFQRRKSLATLKYIVDNLFEHEFNQ